MCYVQPRCSGSPPQPRPRGDRAWPGPSLRSHDTGLNVLADALVVVVMVVGAAGRGVEGGDAVEAEDEVLPVAHRRGVVLVSGQPHCKEGEKKTFQKRIFR